MKQYGLNFKQHGFNIIELLTIVAVIGVVAAFTAPGYENFIKNQALDAASTEIISTFQMARTEAIKRSSPIKVCFKSIIGSSPMDCDDPQIISDNIDRIIAFSDTDNDNNQDATEVSIYESNPFNDNIRLKQLATLNVGGSITYNQKGAAEFQADPDQVSAYIAICDIRNSNSFARLISLSVTGRATLSKLPDNGFTVDALTLTCTV